jgi:hypothetical protein
MASEVTREEFESRVGVVEREVEGEKMVTRYILEQTRRNSDDLAAIKTRLDRVEGKVDGVDRKSTAWIGKSIDWTAKSMILQKACRASSPTSCAMCSVSANKRR